MAQRKEISIGDRVCLLGTEFGKYACGTISIDNIIPVHEQNLAEFEEVTLVGQGPDLGDFVIVGRMTKHGDLGEPKRMTSVVIKHNSEFSNLGPLNSVAIAPQEIKIIHASFAEAFGKIIHQKRDSLRLTTRDLEKLSGVGQSYISRIENGGRGQTPQARTIDKLCKALGFSPEVIEMLKLKQIPSEEALRADLGPSIVPSFNAALAVLLPDEVFRRSFEATAEGAGLSAEDLAKFALTAAATGGLKPPSKG